jgi:hypothetical protein
MFCTARLTSQGAQRQYTASNTQDTEDISKLHLFLRQNHMVRLNHDDDDDDDDQPILRHEVSDYIDTPYLSQQADQIMRAISRSINEEDSI